MFKWLLSFCLLTLGVLGADTYKTKVGENQIFVASLKDNAVPKDRLIPTNEKDKKLISELYKNKKINKHNVVLIKNPNFTALIDTGYLDTLDKLEAFLEDNQVKSEELDYIILTHAHPDHIGALMGEKNPFPKAKILIDKQEYDYWVDSDNEDIKKTLEKLENKEFFSHDKELIEQDSGLRALEAYGHTPGHNIIMIGTNLAFWADLIHAFDAQIKSPEIAISFDVDKEEAIKTREKFFKEFKEKKIQILGSHMPFVEPIILTNF